MKVNLSMSKRVDAYGHSEIMLLVRRRLDGKVIDIHAKSGVFIDPKQFDLKKKTVKAFAANKLVTAEVKYHNAQLKKLNALLARINEAYNNEPDKNNVRGKWLENVVGAKGAGNQYKEDKRKDIYQLFDNYLQSKPRSMSTKKNLASCIRSVARYEMYVRETDRKRTGFTFDVDAITRKDIEDYKTYISQEKELSKEQPKLFERIFSNCPAYYSDKVRFHVKGRGGNSIHKMMQGLKQFFAWLSRERITDNRPFDGVEIGGEKYGTPYYISGEERDIIAATPMPTKALETYRDVFVFQCLIGCRVSDLARLTSDNITDGILVYTPHKTKEEGRQALQARVPLHPKAVALIEKYSGQDRLGRLFPLTNKYIYNDAIKEVFTIAGITRMVEVRNTITGEIENRPINEVASSHLARRTFVGNLYSKVADPNLIGKMSGHVDGSKAFARYRRIEDDTLKSVIELL